MAIVGLLAGASTRGEILACTSAPSGAPPFIVELIEPTLVTGLRGCEAQVIGRVLLQDRRPHDLYIVVDSSGSTAGTSGVDVDGDGAVGVGDWRSNTDPGDSTLRAELEAVRRGLSVWQGHDVRVAIEEYSAVIPIPPGEPSEQGRIRTVQGLTADFNAVRTGLDTIASADSVGGTDYGGALLELAREFDRSGTPARKPIAFFLSDGKPTYPRYPYDQTEPPDVDYALEGAAAVASRGLATSTLEIGVFDDVGVLRDVARLTGGTLLPGLGGVQLLDALASMNLDGFTQVEFVNETTGERGWTNLDAFGFFTATIQLADGPNNLTFVAILRAPGGEWTISCPIVLTTSCFQVEPIDAGGGTLEPVVESPEGTTRRYREGRGGTVGTDGLRSRIRYPHPWTRGELSRWDITPCPSLDGQGGFGSPCDDAIRQLTALLLSVEDGFLRRDCLLDPAVVPQYRDVGELIDAIGRALDSGDGARCQTVAARAALVTSGPGLAAPLQGPPPTGGPYTFDCTTRVDGADVDVTVSMTSPAPGTTGLGRDCPATLEVTGESSARGTTNHDVYFVMDTSGSTAGDSGRDIDGDGANENTLDSEIAAIRAFVSRLDPAFVRVALIEFSAVIPIPPGEPNEQGRIRTVQGLTPDFAAFDRALDTVRAAGSVGATDYGGALMELAAEYDRNGDPARGSVAFFLSDGKPTFPRYPYDSSETPDVDYAMQGAGACATRGITVNTYEVGVFDDIAVLESVAQVTGGRHYGDLSGGAVYDTLPGSSLVGIASVVVTNLLTGDTFDAQVAPDGSWTADIELVNGENRVMVTITSDRGEEIVDCTTIFIGECLYPPCTARSPDAWYLDECQ
jgi:Mg-chelatase subunit ChlD